MYELREDSNPQLSKAVSAYLKYAYAKDMCVTPPRVHFDVDLTNSNIFTVDLKKHIPRGCQLVNIDIPSLEIADIVASNGNYRNDRQVLWKNENDATIYQAYCNIGSYDVNGMVTELLRAMNAVRDESTGGLHNWFASYTATPMNGIYLHNVVFVSLSTDPLQCRAGSSSVVVTYANHNLSIDDFITFRQVQNNPGGFANAMFNNVSLSVSAVIDVDHFVVDVSSVAYVDTNSTAGDGGGDMVLLGRGRNYSFFQSTALTLLGFPASSGTNVATKYGLTADVFAQPKIPLPAPLLNDHPELQAGDVVEVIGLEGLNLPTRYTVGPNRYELLPPVTWQTTSAASIIQNKSERDRERVYFVNPPTFAVARKQTNVFDSGSLYASMNLAGNVYCFLTEMLVKKHMAKIQLRSGNGYIDYNTHIVNKLTAAELQTLQNNGKLVLTLSTPRGLPLYTKGLKLSGTLEFQSAPNVGSNLKRILRSR